MTRAKLWLAAILNCYVFWSGCILGTLARSTCSLPKAETHWSREAAIARSSCLKLKRAMASHSAIPWDAPTATGSWLFVTELNTWGRKGHGDADGQQVGRGPLSQPTLHHGLLHERLTLSWKMYASNPSATFWQGACREPRMRCSMHVGRTSFASDLLQWYSRRTFASAFPAHNQNACRNG